MSGVSFLRPPSYVEITRVHSTTAPGYHRHREPRVSSQTAQTRRTGEGWSVCSPPIVLKFSPSVVLRFLCGWLGADRGMIGKSGGREARQCDQFRGVYFQCAGQCHDLGEGQIPLSVLDAVQSGFAYSS